MHATSRTRRPAPTPAADRHQLPGCIATIVQCAAGVLLVTDGSGSTIEAQASTHLPALVVGQSVLLVFDPAGDRKPLVTAAWPAPDAPPAFPWAFDPATGDLSLLAATLNLEAGTLTLKSGDARLRLTADGVVELRGDRITSAAIETHRIEGGSIEFN